MKKTLILALMMVSGIAQATLIEYSGMSKSKYEIMLKECLAASKIVLDDDGYYAVWQSNVLVFSIRKKVKDRFGDLRSDFGAFGAPNGRVDCVYDLKLEKIVRVEKL